jgi:hypothetical protein
MWSRCLTCKLLLLLLLLLLRLLLLPPRPLLLPRRVLQILHAYMAEPFAAWDGLQRGSTAYESLKAQKADVLWGLVQQVCVCLRISCFNVAAVGTVE